jgi:hypothetical protein
MEKKFYLTLSDEFIEFCRINNIDDVLKTANEVFNRGFTILKYGDVPPLKVVVSPRDLDTEPEITEELTTQKQHKVDTIKKSNLYAQ